MKIVTIYYDVTFDEPFGEAWNEITSKESYYPSFITIWEAMTTDMRQAYEQCIGHNICLLERSFIINVAPNNDAVGFEYIVKGSSAQRQIGIRSIYVDE